jgi:hypothetical protein
MSGHKDDIAITRLIAAAVHEKMPPCRKIAREQAGGRDEAYYSAGKGSAAVV